VTVSLLMLIVLSACLHVYWNVLVKKTEDRLCFLWWMYVISFPLVPVVVAFIESDNISTVTWLVICLSGFVHALYTIALSYAYDNGDLSLVYPLARSAPVFVTVGAIVLLGEMPSIAGFAGIILIVAGSYIVGLESLTISQIVMPMRMLKDRAYQLALLSAAITGIYSVVDRIGVYSANPFKFIVLLLCVEAVFYTPFVLWKRNKVIVEEWRKNKAEILKAGIARFLSYMLILYVMLHIQLSYVIAVRQISIIIAVLTGALMLREAHLKTRIIGSIGILAGVILIGVKG